MFIRVCARAIVLLCTAVLILAGPVQAASMPWTSANVTDSSESFVCRAEVIVGDEGTAEPRNPSADQQLKATHIALQIQLSMRLDGKLTGKGYGC